MADTVYSVSKFIAFVVAAMLGIPGLLAGSDPLSLGLRVFAAFFTLTILGNICARILQSGTNKAEVVNQDSLGGLVNVVLPETDGDEDTANTTEAEELA